MSQRERTASVCRLPTVNVCEVWQIQLKKVFARKANYEHLELALKTDISLTQNRDKAVEQRSTQELSQPLKTGISSGTGQNKMATRCQLFTELLAGFPGELQPQPVLLEGRLCVNTYPHFTQHRIKQKGQKHHQLIDCLVLRFQTWPEDLITTWYGTNFL